MDLFETLGQAMNPNKETQQEESWEALNSEMSDALNDAMDEITRLETELKEAKGKLRLYERLNEHQLRLRKNIQKLIDTHKNLKY